MLHGTEMIVPDEGWKASAPAAGLGTYERLAEYTGDVFSETSTTRVYRLNPNPDRWPGGVFLKRFFYPSPWRFFLRPAKPYVEARNYQFLRELGLNVPDVLAFGQRRRYGGLIDAVIVTAGIVDARSLETYFSGDPPGLSPEELMEVLDQMARIVATMHQANFFHIDLQWRNILIQRPPAGGSRDIRVYLIDCPRGGRRVLPFRSWNGRLHDLAGLEKLAGLYLSPKERVKWFKQYTGVRKLSWQDRRLIQSIIRELESRRKT